jgi:hypothetical protein
MTATTTAWASLSCLLVMMGRTAPAQEAKQEVLPAGFVVTQPDEKSVVGKTWHYYYHVVSDSLSPADVGRVADAIRELRMVAEPDLVASLVTEEQSLRDEAKRGVDGWNQTHERWCFVGTNGDLFERALIDGGYNRSLVGDGITEQALIHGEDVFYRTDSAEKDVTGSFQVDRRARHHSWQTSIFVDAWRDHVRLIDYCCKVGSAKQPGVLEVDKMTLRLKPPLDIVFPYHGERLVMQLRRSPVKLSVFASLFDRETRLSYEWVSEWIDGQPVRLLSRWYWTASTRLRTSREFVFPRVSDHGPMPGLAEIVAFPFEKRRILDLRQELSPEVDPLGPDFIHILKSSATNMGGQKPDLQPVKGVDAPGSLTIDGLQGRAEQSLPPAPLPWRFEFLAGDTGARDLRFALFNGAHEPLSLKKVSSSCGCVQIRSFDKNVGAFLAANVDFTLDIPELDKVAITVEWERGSVQGKTDVLVLKRPRR